MLSDTINTFQINRDFSQAGFYETTSYKTLIKEVCASIKMGKMVAISGIVGSGKTSTLQSLQTILSDDKKVEVCTSYSIEKSKLNLVTLMTALFYDLAGSKDKFPTAPEKRERKLRELIQKKNKPVVLFIDEAHDLHAKTLVGLKRLMEMIRLPGGGSLSIVLAGHPKLANNLKRPAMEEIGARTEIFELELFKSNEEKYAFIEWILIQSLKPKDVIQDNAIKLLCEILSTPLQIEQHLRAAFDKAAKVGQKPLNAEVVQNIISNEIDGLEPKLVRWGYNPKALSEILNVRTSEVRHFLNGKLPESRSAELKQNLRVAGLPV